MHHASFRSAIAIFGLLGVGLRTGGLHLLSRNLAQSRILVVFLEQRYRELHETTRKKGHKVNN